MNNILFFQTQQIPDDTILFNQLKEQNIFFSYFLVDQKYYLFLYTQKSINIDFLSHSVDLIQELDSKQRKIRSLRGFFLYALEIIENGKDYEILETNLQPFFWRKVKNIIRQNKKGALLEFLFGSQELIAPTATQNDLKEKIESLETQVSSLQHKVIELEQSQTLNLNHKKICLSSELLKRSQATKIDQQGDSSLNPQSANLLPNDSEVRNPTYQRKGMESKSVSDDPKIDFKSLSNSQQYNIPSNQNEAQNRANFITLGKISEQEKLEIIQTGFQLNEEGKISLKKYCESTDPYSLFQSKGYSIKYETVRRTKLYKNLND